MKAEKRGGEFDTRSTGEMFCPHCGESQSEPWEFSKDDGETDCEDCGASFTFSRFTLCSYTTTKPVQP